MPEQAPSIVVDTNVLYAALYSASGKSFQLIEAIRDGRVRMVLSTTLLYEYEDVLKRNLDVLSLSEAEAETVLDNLCALAVPQAVYFLWRPCLPDAKDDMVLELAVAAQVGSIVTFNARDFLPASRFGIEVLSPKQLLERLP